MHGNDRKYKCLIFDFDGTLLDSTTNICESVIYAAKKVNLPVPNFEYIAEGIGKSFDQQYTRLFLDNNNDYQYAVSAKDLFKEVFYSKYNILEPMLYHGVIDMLNYYKNNAYRLSIATSGSRSMLDRLLPYFDIGQYFHITCSASEFSAKPDPEMINYIISTEHLKNEEVVIIGDSIFDILAAKNAGIDSVLVHNEVGSVDATYTLDHISNLNTIIK